MKIESVHHVAIICSDYEKSKDFYSRILGFEIIKETYRENRKSYKLDLKVGSHCQLELFSFPDSPPRPSYPEATGLRHLAFAVADIQDTVTELNTKGVKTEPIRTDEGTLKKFTFFSDPDGLPLEVYEI
jgi:glyoxylase I family protein